MSNFPDIKLSRVDELHSEEWKSRGVRVLVKRDDLIHPEISGNKWRKLKYNVELCRSKGKDGILTFGGAFSNHLVATAAACYQLGLKSIGLVRGEELTPTSNDTLKRCDELGMHLIFLSREEYQLRNDKAYHETLMADYSSFQLIPEGGANYYGMIGCQEILNEVKMPVDHIFLAQGTTTTSCGIILSTSENQHVHVIPALKGFNAMEEMTTLFNRSAIASDMIDELLGRVTVHADYHFGGYAKCPDELLDFMESFYTSHQLKLDPIYTGKAMYGMVNQLKNSEFDHSTCLFIHTGGLQGIRGVEERMNRKLFTA